MTLEETMAALEARGSEQTRKTYARHGATGPMFGVSFADLGKLAKQAGYDQPLAEALWDTGNADARNLAAMVCVPATFTPDLLDAWAAAGQERGTAAEVGAIAAESPHGRTMADRWRASGGEFVAAAGWACVGRLALADPTVPDAWFAACLDEIEGGLGAAKNRTREAMNNALISIGGRSPALRDAALAAADRIGPVEVDHGDTACKTHAARPYIEKLWAHAGAKGFATPAAQEQARKRPLGSCRPARP